jgi:hypothetical protein
MRENPIVSEATCKYNKQMSNKAISDSRARLREKSDNPQEMLKFNARNYYYSGFFAGEMTCSVIKASTHNKNPGYYYTVDFTVSNADKNLLESINQKVMRSLGSISPIKGAFNLKLRGKRKVSVILDFLKVNPVIAGDLAINRIDMLRKALAYLDAHKGKRAQSAKLREMDAIRKSLRVLKEQGIVKNSYDMEYKISDDYVGYFLSGVLDGEGSFGFKSNGKSTKEPFFVMAMKDRKIVELLCKFIGYGSVRYRKDGVYHYEVNQRRTLKKICNLFLKRYPLRHSRQLQRLQKLQQILND